MACISRSLISRKGNVERISTNLIIPAARKKQLEDEEEIQNGPLFELRLGIEEREDPQVRASTHKR